MTVDSQYLQFDTHSGARRHITRESRKAIMAEEGEHREEPSQGSPANHPEALSLGANA